jgi:hypothetical protein
MENRSKGGNFDTFPSQDIMLTVNCEITWQNIIHQLGVRG